MKSLSSIFSCCFGWSQGCVFQKSFISVSITLFTYFDKWTIKFQWTNNQHITLLYNEMKSLSSIFSCCFGWSQGCVFQKSFISVSITLFTYFDKWTIKFQWTNNQHITLLYNEMKSLSSIFSCCFGPKGVSSRNALFLCQLHFSLNIRSQEMKSLSSIFSCCFGPKGVSSRKAIFLC